MISCSQGVCKNQKYSAADDAFDISLVDSSLEDPLVCYDDLLPVDPSYSISAIVNVLVSILNVFLLFLCNFLLNLRVQL